MQITVLQARTMAFSPVFTMRMPAAISYKFAKLAKIVREEFKDSEEARNKLLQDHNGVLREEENRWVFLGSDGKKEDPEKLAAFEAEWKQIRDQTVEIGPHFPMPLPDLPLSPDELMQLEPLFTDPDEGGAKA
jgi:hypothetical protein